MLTMQPRFVAVLVLFRPVVPRHSPHAAFFYQFNVPFKIISLIETSQSIGGQNGSTPGKPPDTPTSRTCLVSHVASTGLEPTPDTAVTCCILDES